MITVKQLLQTKTGETWTIGPDATVRVALQMLADKDIGALVVTEGDKLVGIFSERDYARKGLQPGQCAEDRLVRDLMTQLVYYVRPEQTIADCMALMTNKHIRHLPVLEGEKLVGIVTIGDIVKAIITEQEVTIDALQKYISGAGY